MRCLVVVLAATLAVTAPAFAQDHTGEEPHAAPASAHGQHWSYDGPTGPRYWGRIDPAYAACDTGQQESPIDLSNAIDAEIGALDIHWRPLPGRVFDTGHAIQVETATGSNMTMGGQGYQLLQFHVHQPSEHLLNGHRYPLEIHFVHTAPDGSLAVVGVFAEQGTANPVLQAVLDAAKSRPEAERPTLDLNGMLPEARDYFRYEGSLTTPPCSEVVNWAVLGSPITVSTAQIEAFGRLHPGNTRPLQPLNRRFLLHSGR